MRFADLQKMRDGRRTDAGLGKLSTRVFHPGTFGHGWVGDGCYPKKILDGCGCLGEHPSAFWLRVWVSGATRYPTPTRYPSPRPIKRWVLGRPLLIFPDFSRFFSPSFRFSFSRVGQAPTHPPTHPPQARFGYRVGDTHRHPLVGWVENLPTHPSKSGTHPPIGCG